MTLALTDRGTKSLAYASQSTNTLTSNSFSPASGALLVVVFTEVTTDASHSLTMSSTFTGQGAWTTYSAALDDGFGNKTICRIAWSVCGASPGTGTVTCTRRAGTFSAGMFAQFLELTGQDGTTPVRQNVTNTGTGTSLATNFASAVLSGSINVLGVHGTTSGSAPTIPTGTTALGSFDNAAGNNFWGEAAYDTTPVQNNSWTGLQAQVVVGVAIEVAASTATNAAATNAAVTASAKTAQVSIKPSAGVAAVTSSAASATTKVSPTQTTATVGAAANTASVSTSSGVVNASAQTASVAAAAGTASTSIAPRGTGTAAVTGAAGTASGSVAPNAATATVTVAATGLTPTIYEQPTPITYSPSSAALLDLTVAQRREGFRFYLLDSGNNRIGVVYPMLGVRIENNTTQFPMRRMSGFKLSADDIGSVNPIEHRIAPVMLLENGTEWPLGVFMFADTSDQVFSYGTEMEATLVDQGLILGQTLRYPLGFDAGELVTDCMRRVAETAGISTSYIDASSATLGTPLAFLAGGSDTYYGVMAKLGAIAGFYAPYFDNDGRLTGRIAIDPSTSSPTVTAYEAGGRIIAGTILRSNNLLTAPNVYMVVDSSSRDAPVRAEYEIPASAPHSIARRNFAITNVTQAPGIGNSDQAYELARQLAQTEPKAYETVNFQSATDPRHDTFDVIQFLGDTFIETAWGITCLPGGPMDHELKRVYL